MSLIIWEVLKSNGSRYKPSISLNYLFDCPCCHYAHWEYTSLNGYAEFTIKHCMIFCPIKWDWGSDRKIKATIGHKSRSGLISENNLCHGLFWKWYNSKNKWMRKLYAYKIYTLIKKSLKELSDNK